MSVKLLPEHHLKYLSLKGVCTGSSESILVKMPHCLKSHVAAHVASVPCGPPCYFLHAPFSVRSSSYVPEYTERQTQHLCRIKNTCVPYLNLLVKPRMFFRFSGKKYNFMHFERRNAFQNA